MRFMLAAVTFSALFLVSYVVYHSFHGDTRFPGQGLVRPIYFFILISHIGLSIVALPMILTTLFYAATARFGSHRADRALHAADLVLRVGDRGGGVSRPARVRLTRGGRPWPTNRSPTNGAARSGSSR